MDLNEAMRTTAAVREFTDDPVPPEALHRILEMARFAPSGGNLQGWHVIVVRDPAIRRAIAEASQRGWERYLAEQMAGHRAFSVVEPAPPDVPVPAEVPAHPTFERIESVPEVLVISVDLHALAVTDRDLDRPSIVGGGSIYPLVQNILLAARAEGLGGVLTTFLAEAEAELAPLLGLPEHHALAALLALGTPVQQPTRLRRRPVEAFTTVDRIDGPPFLVDPAPATDDARPGR